jgi:hypothetical protein
VALSENSWEDCIYGSFAGFTAFSIVAALRLRGAAASPDPRKANATWMRLCSILSDVAGCILLRYTSILESRT